MKRRYFLFLLVLGALLLLAPLLSAWAMETDLALKFLPPSPTHPFGTDQLGRDMLVRTLAGLGLSLRVGVVTAAAGAVLALGLGLCSATLGGWADTAIGFVIDLMLGVPHILLLVLVSLACGRGFWGVTLALTLTHWPALARLLRGEVLQLRERTYIQAAAKLGQSKWYIARRHFLPHLAPQFFTGALLILPHAILHEAALTFLGFGLPPETPAIGVILSESTGFLAAGKWWLAVFPGLMLVGTVAAFSALRKRPSKGR